LIYWLNWSILISQGKENNYDSNSNGEWIWKSVNPWGRSLLFEAWFPVWGLEFVLCEAGAQSKIGRRQELRIARRREWKPRGSAAGWKEGICANKAAQCSCESYSLVVECKGSWYDDLSGKPKYHTKSDSEQVLRRKDEKNSEKRVKWECEINTTEREEMIFIFDEGKQTFEVNFY